MDNVRESLGKNIQKYRKKLNLSQQQLANAVGVKSLTTVSSWERGANAPDISIICELCELFKITMEDLLGVEYLKFLDSVTDTKTIHQEIKEIENIQNYFKLLGFAIEEHVAKWHWEDDSKEVQIIDEIEYLLSKEKQSVVISAKEFEEIQSRNKDVVEGIFYKKLMQKVNKNA